MKNTTLVIYGIAIVVLITLFGFVLPAMVSSTSTELVVGAFGLIAVLIIGGAVGVNSLLITKNKEKR